MQHNTLIVLPLHAVPQLPLPLSEDCIQRIHRRAQEGVRATLQSFEPGLCNGIKRAPGASRLYGGLVVAGEVMH